MHTICRYINPYSQEFREFHAWEEFKKLSCCKQLGIVAITTLVACTIIFSPFAIPIFRYLVDRCTVVVIKSNKESGPEQICASEPVTIVRAQSMSSETQICCEADGVDSRKSSIVSQKQTSAAINSLVDPSKEKMTSSFTKPSAPVSAHSSDVTAEDFLNYLGTMYTILDKDPQQALKKIQQFLKRGGILRILDKGRCLIPVLKDERVITGCHAGINRSQVAAAVMKNMGVEVQGVFAGQLMGFYGGETYLFAKMPHEMSDSEQFKQAFGMEKTDQIGRKEAVAFFNFDLVEGEFSKKYAEAQQNTRQFFQNYIDQLSATHFITFAESGPHILTYLLNRPSDLSGFIITYSAWKDEVEHPRFLDITPVPGRQSKEAYQGFAKKIQSCFHFEGLPAERIGIISPLI